MGNKAKILFAGLLMLVAAIAINAGDVLFQNGNLNVSQDLLVDTNTLYVNSATGSVGIGTASPGYKLDVRGGADTNIAAIIESGTTEGIFLGTKEGSGTIGVSYVSGGSYLPLVFETSDTDRMTITVGGNVGIGTTSPQNVLNVQKNGAGIQSVLTLSNDRDTSQADNDGVRLRFGGGRSDGAFFEYVDIDAEFDDVTLTTLDSSLLFKTYSNNVQQNVLSLVQDKVGIGTTSPNATLTIKTGGTTIADSWDVRSERDLKDEISELNVSSFDFSTAKLYSYKLKYSETNPETNQTEQKLTKTRVGLMQDEVPPECRVGNAVDTYCLLAVAYVKIAQLEAEIKALKP